MNGVDTTINTAEGTAPMGAEPPNKYQLMNQRILSNILKRKPEDFLKDRETYEARRFRNGTLPP